MELFNIIVNFLKGKKEVICDHSEHCPIYLSYLGKYGEDSKEIKMCKNPNKVYCRKYNLIDQNEWNKMSTDEKIKLIKDMDLIKYIDKK